MNAREFLIYRGPCLARLKKDAEKMSVAVFMRKHGIDVRECRPKLRRLRELAAAGNGAADTEVRELVGLFEAICLRNGR